MVVQAVIIVVDHLVMEAQAGQTPANRTVITRPQTAGVAVRRIISDKAVVRLVHPVVVPEEPEDGPLLVAVIKSVN